MTFRTKTQPKKNALLKLPHIIHTIVVQPETIGAIRPVHEKLYIFADAVVGTRNSCHAVANVDANARYIYGLGGKNP